MREKIEKILKEYKAYEKGGLTHAVNELLDLFNVSQRDNNYTRKEIYDKLGEWDK